MAAITKNKSKGNTYYRLSVKVDGKVKRISLGSGVPVPVRDKIKKIVSDLEAHYDHGTLPSKATLEEAKSLSDQLRVKLAELGLLESDVVPRLADFIEQFILQHRAGVGYGTIGKWTKVRGQLVAYFGEGRELADITEGDALDYQRNLAALDRSPETMKADLKKARQFFKYATQKRFIDANPFDALKIGGYKPESCLRIGIAWI